VQIACLADLPSSIWCGDELRSDEVTAGADVGICLSLPDEGTPWVLVMRRGIDRHVLADGLPLREHSVEVMKMTEAMFSTGKFAGFNVSGESGRMLQVEWGWLTQDWILAEKGCMR
jgi:hypothetical protein